MQGEVKNKLQYDSEREAQIKNNKKKKVVRSKAEKRDTFTVFAIIAAFFLIVIVLSFIPGDVIDITKFIGHVSKDKQEAIKDAKPLLFGAGIFCVIIIIFCLVKRGKNSKVNDRELEKIFMEQDRLEKAKIRVEAARKNMEEGGETYSDISLKDRRTPIKGRGEHFLADSHSIKDMNEDERQEYLERRQREYRYLMENGDEEEKSHLDVDNNIEYESKSSKKKLVSLLVVAGVVLVIIAAIIIKSII